MYPAVYSYKRNRTRELELSIETLHNIDCWNGEVYIVGDDPKLNTPYTYLKTAHTWGKGNKWNDEVCAYLTGCEAVGDFILMSDDLFILKPWELKRHNRGELSEHIKSRRHKDGYSRQLERTKQFLEDNGRPTLSYEIHIPMLVKAEQFIDAVTIIPKIPAGVFIRSILGNWFDEPSTYLNDPKNKQLDKETVLYSSSDNTFNYEKIHSILNSSN